MPESVLIRVARGDDAAVRECIDEFGALVWAMARRLSPSRDDAEDAVQEVFLDLWKSAGRFDPRQGSEKVFITMIARRRLIDRLRRHAARPESASADELDIQGLAAPGTSGAIASDAERAAAVVARLTPDQQRVIELAVLHGLSHSEIATRTGLPLGTVKTLMRRGILRARELLGLDASGDVGGGR